MKNRIVGEWQEETNPRGGTQRFRMVGNIKEYEMMVTVDGIQMPQSQVSEYHRRKREMQEQQKQKAVASVTEFSPKTCPFKLGTNAMNTQCSQDCSCFTDGCCVFAISHIRPTQDTRGRKCPIIGRECVQKCALYDAGCKLIEFIKGIARKG